MYAEKRKTKVIFPQANILRKETQKFYFSVKYNERVNLLYFNIILDIRL